MAQLRNNSTMGGDTLVSEVKVQTLINKTLNSPTISGTTNIIDGNIDFGSGTISGTGDIHSNNIYTEGDGAVAAFYKMKEGTTPSAHSETGYAILWLNSTAGKLMLTDEGGNDLRVPKEDSNGAVSITTGSKNVFVGYEVVGAGNREAGAGDNTVVGYGGAYSLTTGDSNCNLGYQAGFWNQTGDENTILGTDAGVGSEGNSHSFNTFIGYQSGRAVVSGSSSVFIGYKSGRYETGSNKLFIDNQARAGEADARTKALIYGVFDEDPANQTLAINADLTTSGINFGAGTISGTGDIYCNDIYTSSGSVHIGDAVLSEEDGSLVVDKLLLAGETRTTWPTVSGAGAFLDEGTHASYGSDVEIGGFTQLGSGAPSIKMKYFTGNTDADSTTNITHGIADAHNKIISVTAGIHHSAQGTYIASNEHATYGYQLWQGVTYIQLVYVAAAMQSRPYKVCIMYQE